MKNNKGFSFVAVIVIMVVIMFLTVSCLAIVNNTYNMKKIETKTDTSFYSAEEEMEQLKSDIVLVCKDSAEKAYVKILSNLSNVPEAQYKDYFAVEFENYFNENYNAKLNDIKSSFDNIVMPDNGITYYQDSEVEVYDKDAVVKVNVPEKIVLKAMSVTKTEENGYTKTVTADLVITPPDFFNKKPVQDNAVDYQDFVLVTDDCIEFDGKTTTVDGSIYASGHSDEGLESSYKYAGDGVVFDNGAEVNFFGKHYLLSRANFTLKGDAAVTIKDTDMYVKNIKLNSSGSGNKGASKLKINGNMFVEDSMNLDLKGSSVILSGTYLGYSDEENGSSIVINEPETEVDMTKLTDLALGGLTYVESGKQKAKFGSSLDAKFMQTMYLIPGDCLILDGKKQSNPVPNTYDNAGNKKIPKIDLQKYKKIDLLKYCNDIDNYYAVDVNGATYYFLKFKDDESAKNYAQKYLNKNNALMNYKADSFQYGNVYLSDNTLIRAKGILVGYRNKKLVISNTNAPKGSALFSDYDGVRKRANSFLSTLKNGEKEESPNTNIFTSIFKELQPEETTSVATYLYTDDNCDGKGYIVKIVKGDCIVSGDFKGLVIATGKVIIKDNAKVIGNVFAGDGIIVGNNVTLFSNDNGIYPFVFLTQNYTKKNEIRKYFNEIGISEDTKDGSADVEDNVKYDNWQTK